MKHTTLRQLLDQIGDYDAHHPIFIDSKAPITATSACFIVLGDHPCVKHIDAVPDQARERGMTRFLSTGQLMEVEKTLSYATSSYSESELIQALSSFFATHVATEAAY